MIRKGLRPDLKLGFDLADVGTGFRRVLPFRRSWLAIAVLAVMDIAFTLPAVFTFNQAITEWGKFETLFDLTISLFLSAWLLGWVIAPLIMTAILVLMLFGRETLNASPGHVDIFLGIPFFGVSARYEVSKIRNLRFEQAPKKSSKSWRGDHLTFDYGANAVAVGSVISSAEVAKLISQLQIASGEKIRYGTALPDEIQTSWETHEDGSFEASTEPEKLNSEKLSLTSPSTLVLIVANLIPIAGKLFLDWNLADVMVLYWAESAVVGFFNVCKIAIISRWMVLLAGPFFIGHFGGFMSIHFLFIYTFFIKQAQTGSASTGELADVAQMFINLWPALVALFISHSFSFYQNFLGRQEYRSRNLKGQMSEPYGRIIFMHMVLIFGGGLTMILGNPAPILLIVIGLKIFFDVKAHLKQHTEP